MGITGDVGSCFGLSALTVRSRQAGGQVPRRPAATQPTSRPCRDMRKWSHNIRQGIPRVNERHREAEQVAAARNARFVSHADNQSHGATLMPSTCESRIYSDLRAT